MECDDPLWRGCQPPDVKGEIYQECGGTRTAPRRPGDPVCKCCGPPPAGGGGPHPPPPTAPMPAEAHSADGDIAEAVSALVRECRLQSEAIA
jgi:hypothetical protein